MADKTINLDPYHCEVERDEDGFCLVFFGKTEGGKTVKVRLHMAFWWVRFLARDLWKVIGIRRAEIEEATKALTDAP